MTYRILACISGVSLLLLFASCTEDNRSISAASETHLQVEGLTEEIKVVDLEDEDIEEIGDIDSWWDDLITDEHPRDFWENQAHYGTMVQRIYETFGGGWPPNYPKFFGGLYLDDMGRLTILIVEALAENDEAVEFLAFVESLGGSNVRYVEFSMIDLLATLDYIFSVWEDNPVMQNVRGTGLDTINNRIEVHLLYGDEEDINQFRSEVLDSPMLTFSGTRGRQIVFETLAEPLHINPALENVRMEATNITTLPEEVTVTIFNDSDYSIFTGEPFTVEAFYNDTWWNVPMSGLFILPAIGVFPGEQWDFAKNLAHNIGSLEPGLYRIRKDVFRDSDTPLQDEDIHDVVAEFYVE